MSSRLRTLTSQRADSVDVAKVRVRVAASNAPAEDHVLGLSPIVVGTDDSCDVVVADGRVSRRHLSLGLEETGVRLRDLGSKNGTWIGTLRVRDAVLPSGTELRLGATTIQIESTGDNEEVGLSRVPAFGRAVGTSVVIRALFAVLERAASTEETVLLIGETGTGKELVARGIHEHSPRAAGPFVVVDCSAIAPTMVEAELFGFVKGAFTGAEQSRVGLLERADGGTIFIDEIGELPLDMQPKLLRALEARAVRRIGETSYRPIDVRVVGATHRNLTHLVDSGAFRRDLYYRLAVVKATIPPLRDRREDIPLLVERFLAEMSPPRTWDDLPPHALELLTAHDWPGNVRELRNMVTRLVLFPAALDELRDPDGQPLQPAIAAVAELPLREARALIIERFERTYLSLKLAETAGNVSQAAKNMGVSRQFLHRLIERYGLRG